MKVSPKPRDLWFEDGFWWYACPSKRAVTRISGLIREELFDIEAIAERLGVSRRGFERLVNNSLGISPGMWLRPERAVWAAFRIREGYLISEISQQLGFNWNSTTPDTAKTYWANGLLKSIDNGVSKSDYAYNNRNLLTSETQTLASRPARVVSYDYDADGLRTDLVYPSTRAVEYAWTSRAQLQSVSADGPPPIATYTYDKAGRSIAVIHENGITESKSYDSASQLLANTHFKNGTAVSGHGYTLDDTGRRTNETFADGSTPARTYGYDAADQVTGASYGSSQSDTYVYDAMGNRTSATIASQGGSTTTYNANNANQYTSITGLTPISHDANGNLLLQNNVTYGWDSENRVLSVTPNTPALGDKSLVHSYDGQHRRVTRTIREWTAGGWSATETTHFIYDGWNVIEEYQLNTSNSVLVRNLTWGQDLGGSSSLQAAGGVGGLIMVEEINGSTTTAYHFHYDGNGNVTEVTDLSGNSAASYRYDAFGNTLVSTGSYAATNRYRFSTKPLDSEVTNAPLYYYGYRYYDPVTGRWSSRDPIKEEGGLNIYGFVGNDGLNDLDVLGEAPWAWGAAIVGGVWVVVKVVGRGMTRRAAQEEVKRRTKVAAECAVIHAAYSALTCKACRKGMDPKAAAAECACWTAKAAGRKNYLNKKCDYYLPGAITKGSKAQEATHKAEYAKASAKVFECCACAAGN